MSKPPVRGVFEDPRYIQRESQERHAPSGGEGTTKEGMPLTNRVYRQPWVEHDGVADPDGNSKEG